MSGSGTPHTIVLPLPPPRVGWALMEGGLRCLLAAKALSEGDAVCGEHRQGEQQEEISLVCAELLYGGHKLSLPVCNEPRAPAPSTAGDIGSVFDMG